MTEKRTTDCETGGTGHGRISFSREVRGITALVFAFAAPLSATSARAQDEDFTEFAAPESALVRVLETMQGEELALDAALTRALENATAAREAEEIVRAAEGEVRREKGAFDPELFADVERRNEEDRNTSPFDTVDQLETEETEVSAGVRTRLRFGTQLQASLESTKLETSSTFATVNPQYDTAGKLSARQPLLKGFGPGSRLGLSTAERLLESAEASRRDLILGVRSETVSAYWDLYAAMRDHAVRLLLVERAKFLLDQARTRADMGLVGPNQVANARVFLAEQELAALDSGESLSAGSDRLSSLLGARPAGSPLYRPLDTPPPTYAIDTEDVSVAKAMTSNQALRAADRDVEALRATWNGSRWNALPTLDLKGSIGGNGLSGTGQDVSFGDTVFPSNIRGDFGDSFEQVTGRDFPTWSLGVEMSVPLGGREGRGERDRLRGLLGRREQQLEAARRALDEEVRARHREVSNGERRLAVAREGVSAAGEQVRIGIIEYRTGRTTAFELVRLAADYAASEQRLSQALVRTAKAAAALQRLTSEEEIVP